MEKWKLDRKFGRSAEGEEVEEGQMRKRSLWVHMTSRAKRGEERRGRRRWWDARVLDLPSEVGKQQRIADQTGYFVRDAGNEGVSADEHQALDEVEDQIVSRIWSTLSYVAL